MSKLISIPGSQFFVATAKLDLEFFEPAELKYLECLLRSLNPYRIYMNFSLYKPMKRYVLKI